MDSHPSELPKENGQELKTDSEKDKDCFGSIRIQRDSETPGSNKQIFGYAKV